jgi:hypothetical protein
MTKSRGIILHVVAGTLGSTIVGLVFYQARVFDLHNAAFQFVLFGATIGLLLGCARRLSLRAFLVAAVLAWAFCSLVSRSSTWELLLRDAVIVAGLSVGAYAAMRLVALAKAAGSVAKRSLIRIAALVAGYLAAGMLLCIVWRAADAAAIARIYARMGLLLAAGTVVGIEVGEWVVRRVGKAVA